MADLVHCLLAGICLLLSIQLYRMMVTSVTNLEPGEVKVVGEGIDETHGYESPASLQNLRRMTEREGKDETHGYESPASLQNLHRMTEREGKDERTKIQRQHTTVEEALDLKLKSIEQVVGDNHTFFEQVVVDAVFTAIVDSLLKEATKDVDHASPHGYPGGVASNSSKNDKPVDGASHKNVLNAIGMVVTGVLYCSQARNVLNFLGFGILGIVQGSFAWQAWSFVHGHNLFILAPIIGACQSIGVNGLKWHGVIVFVMGAGSFLLLSKICMWLFG